MDKASAVRVEVEGFVDDELGAPVTPESELPSSPGNWQVVGLGILAAVALVLALAALQPSEGETAAGTERSATTTTTAPTTTTADTAALSSVASVRQSDEPTAPILIPSEVVRDDIGFFGLVLDEELSLVRSLRGVEWQAVELELSDAASNDVTNWTRHQNLIVIDDGFAVLRTQEDLTELNAPIRIDRLVSSDGVSWDVDAEFEPIVSDRGDGWSFLHFEDSFGITVVHETADLEALLTDVLSESSGVDPADVCWIEPVGTNQIRTRPCEREEGGISFGTDITATDLSDPGSFDALFACADVLSQTASVSGLILLRGRESTLKLQSQDFSFGHQVLADGSITALALGSLLSPDASVCEAFEGALPLLPEPAIELVDAGGETRRLALPIEETDLDGSDHEGWVFPRIRASDDQILLVAGTTTWSVDIRTGDWTKLADLPEPQTEFVEYDFASSEQLVGVSDDDIVVADLVGGTVETFEITNDLGPWARMLYADSDLFLLETEDGIVAVDLPQ